MAKQSFSDSSTSSNDFEYLEGELQEEELYQVPRSVYSLYDVPRSTAKGSKNNPFLGQDSRKNTRDVDSLDAPSQTDEDDNLYTVPTHWPPLLAPSNLEGSRVERCQSGGSSNITKIPKDDTLKMFDPVVRPKCRQPDLGSSTKPGGKPTPKPRPDKSVLQELTKHNQRSLGNLYCDAREEDEQQHDALPEDGMNSFVSELETKLAIGAKRPVPRHTSVSSSSSEEAHVKLFSDLTTKKLKKKLTQGLLKKGKSLFANQEQKIRELSKSVLSVTGLESIEKSQCASVDLLMLQEKVRKPFDVNAPKPIPKYKPVINLYLEGVMGTGKTTMLKCIEELLGEDVLLRPEPMKYWTEVFDNALKTIKKNNKKKKTAEETSALMAACQHKFATPFRLVESKKQMHLSKVDGVIKAGPMHNWFLHDRHLISPTVIFPLCHFKNGTLSGRDFLQLVATFQGNETDNVVWLKLGLEENLKRLKKRGRKHEESITGDYLSLLNECFHCTYCGWLLTQYIPPEHITQVCLGAVSMSAICRFEQRPTVLRTAVAEKLFLNSIFEDLKNLIEPYNTDAVVAQLCLTFATELSKIQFSVLNYEGFENDESGCWTEIYTRCLRNPNTKSQILDWTAISEFVQDLTE